MFETDTRRNKPLCEPLMPLTFRPIGFLLSVPLIAFAIVTLAGCNQYDKEYFPYSMIGLNVWVYDSDTDKIFPGGSVKASYDSRKEGLSRCEAIARTYAQQHHFQSWRYVCCTVTPSENCMTKVR